MPRIPVHDLDSAPEQSRDVLKVLAEKFGKVLNIHGEMAHAPVVLQAYGALQQVIADHGTFDAATREAIALTVGNVDGCAYCQSAHTAAGMAAGLTEGQTVAIRAGTVDFDPSSPPCWLWRVSRQTVPGTCRTGRGRPRWRPDGATPS